MRSMFVKVVVIPVLCCLAAITLNAATVCVGPSATGNGSGSNWTNQAAWSSLSPVRGNTYYLADGSYAGKTFNTAASGSTLIIIKKAIVGDAAAEAIAGWSPTLGDGQATFTGTITFNTSYWVFDGMKGGNLSKTASAYGFAFPTSVNYPLRTYNASSTISDITMSRIAATATGSDVEKWFHWTSNDTQPVNRVTLSHCYGDGWGNFQHATSPGRVFDGWITEYCVILNTFSTAAHHGEDLNNNGGRPGNWTVRYNLFEGTQGTGPTMVIGALNNSAGPYYIYGNVFKDKRYTDGLICAVNNGFGAHTLTGVVYNNTFINCSSVYPGVHWVGGAGNNQMTVQNNLVANMPAPRSTSGTISHNAYYNCTSVPSESNSQVLSSNPFQDISGGDCRLTGATAAGTTLPSTYTTDPGGTTRGGDGTWDRGAYEWTGNTNPAISISPTGQDFGILGLNLFRDFDFTVRNSGGGTLAGTVSVGLPFSVVSGGTYSLGAGQSQTVTIRFNPLTLGTYSRIITFTGGGGATATVAGTAAVPDTTPPSASLSSPANGATISNSVTIAATASDNVGVEGVRFFVNGTGVFDDTASPYSYSWDLSTVNNGSYQICVQARDASGNTAWSGTNVVTVANPPVVIPSPLAYWDFSGSGNTVADRQNSIVLTLRNGAALSAEGRFDTGLLLAGVDERADAPISPILNIAGTTLSVAAWVKLESQGTWQQIVAKVKETGAFTSPYFAWHLFGSHASGTQWTPRFQLVNSSGSSVDIGSSLNVNYGEWAHIVGVYDGSVVRIYVNGVSQGNAVQNGNILNYNQPLYIGAHGLPGEFCKGVIDEVRIYSQALSAAQVQALYQFNGGTSPIVPPSGLHVVGM